MFTIKKINHNDINKITVLQKEIIFSLKEKSLFYPLNMDELECIVKYTGYIIGLYFNEALIGYATIIYCSKDKQLSQIYDIPNKYIPLTAILDDVAISSHFRGKGYQLLLWNYITIHFCSKTKFLLTSIHPDNTASLKNAFRFDMTIILEKKMYNDSLRYILLKRL